MLAKSIGLYQICRRDLKITLKSEESLSWIYLFNKRALYRNRDPEGEGEIRLRKDIFSEWAERVQCLFKWRGTTGGMKPHIQSEQLGRLFSKADFQLVDILSGDKIFYSAIMVLQNTFNNT